MSTPAPAHSAKLLDSAKPDELPTGPEQKGRGQPGQYTYWTTFPHPTEESIRRLGLRSPSEFSRESFAELAVKVHKDCDVSLLETATFLEPHASGKPHLNVLGRAGSQYRWKKVSETFFNDHKIRVNFAPHIKKWVDGIVYGRVASEHKGPAELDKAPAQWSANGAPMSFDDVLPKKWRSEGFVRRVRMTPLAFLGVCREHNLRSESEAWALANEQEEKGDKALMGFLMENDANVLVEKAVKAMNAKEALRASR